MMFRSRDFSGDSSSARYPRPRIAEAAARPSDMHALGEGWPKARNGSQQQQLRQLTNPKADRTLSWYHFYFSSSSFLISMTYPLF